MADVFLSYKREDRGRAREIAEAIQRHGFTVFFDVAIEVGESFDERIEREIAAARCVVVLWSPRSTTAKWVRREARFGSQREHLAPAIIAPCDIPLEFSDVQAANLSSWRGDPGDEQWRDFIARITECVQKPAKVLPAQPWRRRGPRVAMASVLVLAIAGAGGYAAYRYLPALSGSGSRQPASAPATASAATPAAVAAPPVVTAELPGSVERLLQASILAGDCEGLAADMAGFKTTLPQMASYERGYMTECRRHASETPAPLPVKVAQAEPKSYPVPASLTLPAPPPPPPPPPPAPEEGQAAAASSAAPAASGATAEERLAEAKRAAEAAEQRAAQQRAAEEERKYAEARQAAEAAAQAQMRAASKASAGPADVLKSLVAASTKPLDKADFARVAGQLGVEPAALMAAVSVEGSGNGFGPDGRPLILFEPHIFSRLTAHRFDASHPSASYLTWGSKPYPSTQAGRWAQLKEAAALDPGAALQATSWGRFQIIGMNYKRSGFDAPEAFAAAQAKSEASQLDTFANYLASNGLVEKLKAKDWAGFSRLYNGPGQADAYAKKLADAYLKAAQ